MLARTPALARSGLARLTDVLHRLRLRLRDGSVAPVDMRLGVSWLGVRLQPRNSPLLGHEAFGYVIPSLKVQEMVQRLSDMTLPPHDRIDASAFNLNRWLVSINQQLRQWRQSYLFADNAPEIFRLLDQHAQERVAQLLGAVLGMRRTALEKTYRTRLPRGFSTWEFQGARLVVLSSLAPHFPDRLTRKPAWMMTGKPFRQARPADGAAAPPKPASSILSPPPADRATRPGKPADAVCKKAASPTTPRHPK